MEVVPNYAYKDHIYFSYGHQTFFGHSDTRERGGVLMSQWAEKNTKSE